MGTFIVVSLAIAVWAVALYYCVGTGIDRITSNRLRPHIWAIVLMAFLWPLAALFVWGTGMAEGVHPDRPRREELGEQFEAASWIAFGLGFFLLGSIMMAQVISVGQVAALAFGSAFIGASWLVLRRYRSNWRRFTQGGHRNEVLAHLLAIPALAVIGVLILIAAL